MSQKYTVTALDRSGMGHPNYHTPGRAWPSGKPVEVEVVDQDADPMLAKEVDGEVRKYPDPVRIGRESWKRICADPRLTVRAIGDDAQDVQALATKLTAVERALKAAEARADEAETRLRQAESAGPEVTQRAQAEAVRLQGVVDKLTAELDKANARATSAEEQLEELTAPATGDAPKSSEPVPPAPVAQPKAKPAKGAKSAGG
jgi:hypothetical protein